MKKVTLAIAMAALVLFAGCKKENETKGTTLKASIEQNQSDSKTSLDPGNGAIKWTAGDKILVYNGTSSATFTLSTGAGSTNGTFNYAGEFEITDDTKAAYPETCVITDNGMTFTLPEEQNLAAPGSFANGANPMLGVNTGNGFTFVSVCGGLGLSLTGDNIDITAIEIVSEGEMLTGTYTGYFNNDNIDVANGTSSVRLNCTTTLTSEAKEFYFVLPVGTLANGFTMNIYSGADVIYTKSTTSTALEVQLNMVKTMATLNVGPEYVDLGLPSGLLWATSNVGTFIPEGYGDYFAWGETTPKDTTYNWQTYQHGMGGGLTKYCSNSHDGYHGFTDNLTTLLPEDDAATANWGNGWRMPTDAEFEELFNNTTVTWTQQGGVNGCLFTATNGNSIFLPAAGYRWNYELDEFGEVCDYWSSSLQMDYQYDARLFYSYSNSVSQMGYVDRTYGQSVRPVREN